MADAATSLDLSSLVALDTFDLVVMKPGTSEPTGWVITLAGPAHPVTIALNNEIGRENLEKEKAIEFAQVNGRKWKVEDETVDERRRRNVSRVCRRIVSWAPDPLIRSFAPEPIRFSHETATELFLRPEHGSFLLQLTEYLAGERAFMSPSGKT